MLKALEFSAAGKELDFRFFYIQSDRYLGTVLDMTSRIPVFGIMKVWPAKCAESSCLKMKILYMYFFLKRLQGNTKISGKQYVWVFRISGYLEKVDIRCIPIQNIRISGKSG